MSVNMTKWDIIKNLTLHLIDATYSLEIGIFEFNLNELYCKNESIHTSTTQNENIIYVEKIYIKEWNMKNIRKLIELSSLQSNQVYIY